MHTKNSFLRFESFLIKDGSEIRFWEDTWLGNTPLKDQYPAFYTIAHGKSDTITVVLSTSPPNVSFRRDVLGPRLTSWHALQERLAAIQLVEGHDEFRWNLHENGKFSVDSMYKALLHSEIPTYENNKNIWKMKVPLKVKIFCMVPSPRCSSHKR